MENGNLFVMSKALTESWNLRTIEMHLATMRIYTRDQSTSIFTQSRVNVTALSRVPHRDGIAPSIG